MRSRRFPFVSTASTHRSGLGAGLLALIIFAGGNAVCAQSSALAAAPTGIFGPLAATVPSSPPFPSVGFELGPSLSTAGTEPLEGDAPVPDAPLAQLSQPKPAAPVTPGTAPMAPLRLKYIPPGWRAQPLNFRGKLALGATDLYSFEDLAAILASAGYEQILNSEPNYGTDRGAFGERLGAAEIREASQGLFTDVVFGPLLHEDTRYYEEGPSYSPVHRTLYAITRPLVSRKDDGGRTVNGALLLGYAASAALTPSFYPQSNRNFHDTLSTFGGSIGGAALGFFVSEFSNDVLQALHLKHNR